MEHRPALDVARAEQLPDIARARRLVLGLVGREYVRLVREVAAEDDRVGPDVAHEVRGCVRRQRGLVVADEQLTEPRLKTGRAAAAHPVADARGADACPLATTAAANAIDGVLRAGHDPRAEEWPRDVVLDDLGARLACDPLEVLERFLLRLLALADRLEVHVVER